MNLAIHCCNKIRKIVPDLEVPFLDLPWSFARVQASARQLRGRRPRASWWRAMVSSTSLKWIAICRYISVFTVGMLYELCGSYDVGFRVYICRDHLEISDQIIETERTMQHRSVCCSVGPPARVYVRARVHTGAMKLDMTMDCHAQYLMTFYWTITTMTTVGYGLHLIPPHLPVLPDTLLYFDYPLTTQFDCIFSPYVVLPVSLAACPDMSWGLPACPAD